MLGSNLTKNQIEQTAYEPIRSTSRAVMLLMLLMLKYQDVEPVPEQTVRPELFCFSRGHPSTDNS